MSDVPKKVAIHGYVDSRLRALIEELADGENIALSDCVAGLLAKAVNRPDLAEVPRKRMGRPRGKVRPVNGGAPKVGKKGGVKMRMWIDDRGQAIVDHLDPRPTAGPEKLDGT